MQWIIMKTYNFILLLLLFFSVSAYGQVSQELTRNSVKNDHSNITDLQVTESLYKKTLAESIAKDRKIDSLQNLLKSKEELTEKIDRQGKQKIDTLQRQLVNITSNFVYIPYDKFSVEEIAIPAFNLLKGTPYFDKYHNRLDMLENYPKDMVSLKEMIGKTIEFLKGKDLNNTLIKKALSNKTNEALMTLKASDPYKRYKTFNDGENTYLGKLIFIYEGILEKPDNQSVKKLSEISESLQP